jgi:hypothetical protein
VRCSSLGAEIYSGLFVGGSRPRMLLLLLCGRSQASGRQHNVGSGRQEVKYISEGGVSSASLRISCSFLIDTSQRTPQHGIVSALKAPVGVPPAMIFT